jgi:hypothetical protein
MAIAFDSERQNRVVWLVLVVLGAALCIVGWVRWAL